jgi:hypothetical protein
MAFKPLAIILCNFTDVPIPNLPPSSFQTFLASGSGGLRDYWYDVSYGQIDLAGSAVFGWWQMKYSFLVDGYRRRTDFTAEARRLAGVNGVDLSKYVGVVSFINANCDAGNDGTDTNACIGFNWGQSNWKWCSKCQAMFYPGVVSSAPCAAGGQHFQPDKRDYSLALNTSAGTPSQDNWRWCKKCQSLNYAGNPAGPCAGTGTHDNSGSGNYALRTGAFSPVPFSPGSFYGDVQWKWCRKCQLLVVPGGGHCMGNGNGPHDTSASEVYGVVGNGNDLNDSFVAHETGHGFGLQHSWSAEPEHTYGNPWDIMGQGSRTIPGLPYSPAGPGMDAPNLDFLGVLPDNFTWKGPPAGFAGEQFQLLTLTNTGAKTFGFWAGRMSKGDRAYYIEFRQPSGWDRAFPRPLVSINEVRTWQWCRKCQELTAVASGVTGQCAGGGVHDHTGSSNYILLRHAPSATPALPSQNDWMWCSKCQALTYAGNSTPGPCPVGGQHDHQRSGNYTLVHDNPYSGSQGNWKWCLKCQSLNYAGNASLGHCTAGGTHDNTNSADYHLLPNIRNSFLLGNAAGATDWQPGQVFVAKDTGMGVVIHLFGSVGLFPTATITVGDVQSKWALCGKCAGLFYTGISMGKCPEGGTHQAAGNTDYSLLHNVHGSSGQNQWRWCSKCQGLAFAGVSGGVCPAGGTHNSASDDYVLLHDVSMEGTQSNWRWCNKCQGLVHADTQVPQGVCPAGGTHNVQSDNYNMINV